MLRGVGSTGLASEKAALVVCHRSPPPPPAADATAPAPASPPPPPRPRRRRGRGGGGRRCCQGGSHMIFASRQDIVHTTFMPR